MMSAMTEEPTAQPDATPADEANAGEAAKPEPQRGFFGKLWHDWVKPLGLVILVVTALRSSLVDWNDVPSGSMRPTILEGDRIVVNKLAYGFNLPFNGPKIDLPLLPTFDNPLDFLPGWHWARPQRGDIVTFWNPTPDEMHGRPNPSSGIRMVKRVVGLPGDTLRVVDGRLKITDKDGNDVDISYLDLPEGPYHVEPTMVVRPDPNSRQLQQQMAEAPVEFAIEDLDGVEHFVQFLQRSGGWTPGGHQYRDIPRDGSAFTLPDSDDHKQAVYFMVGDNRDNSRDSRAYLADDVDPSTNGPVFVRGEHITGKAKFVAVSFDGSWFNPAWSRWFRSFDGAARRAADAD